MTLKVVSLMTIDEAMVNRRPAEYLMGWRIFLPSSSVGAWSLLTATYLWRRMGNMCAKQVFERKDRIEWGKGSSTLANQTALGDWQAWW
jgi:hypothetical protein